MSLQLYNPASPLHSPAGGSVCTRTRPRGT